MADLAELTIRLKSEGAKEVDRELIRVTETSKRAAGAVKGLLGAFLGFQAVKTAAGQIASFEQSMAQVRGIAIKTNIPLAEQISIFQELETAAKSAGATTKFSATQAADAQLSLARAGLSAAQILKALPGTLALAAAGAIDLAQAADVASGTLAQFGLRADQLSDAADVIVGTTNRTRTSVTTLASSLQYAGPLASAFGQSLRDTSAAIGVLGNAGIQGTAAGTNLRGILIALTKTTPAAEKAFQRLGVSLEDVNPLTKSLVDVFGVLREAQLRVGNENFGKAVAEIFGKLNVGGALVLTSNATALAGLAGELKNVGGEAQRLADIQSNTLRGSYLSLKSAIEALSLSLGDNGLLRGLRFVSDFATDVVRVLAGVNAGFATNERAARLVASALAAVAAGYVALKALQLVSFIATLTKATLTLNAVLSANPIGAVAAAVGLLIFAYQELRNETLKIGDETYAVADLIEGVWATTVDVFRAAGVAIAEIWRAVVKSLGSDWTTVLKQITDAWNLLLSEFGLTWDGLWAGLLSIVKTAVNQMIAVLYGLSAVITTVFDRFKNLVVALASLDPSSPIESAKRILDSVNGVFNVVDIVGVLSAKWQEAWERDFIGEAVGMAKLTGVLISKALSSGVVGPGADDPDGFFGPIIRRFHFNLEKIRNGRLAASNAAGAGVLRPSPEPFVLPPGVVGEGGLPDAGELAGAKDALADYNAEQERAAQILERIGQARGEFGRMLEDVRFEQRLIGATRRERELANAARDAETVAARAQGEGVEGLAEAYVAEVAELIKLRREYERGTQRVLDDVLSTDNFDNVADSAGSAFGRFFGDLITQANSAKDALRNLAQSVIASFTEAFVTKPISGLASSLFSSLFSGLGAVSAMGNAFSNGRVLPFASGGVIDSPILFPLRNGAGLAGEAGPEAILPLSRGSDGRLGVRSADGGGADQRTINIRLSLPNVRDPADFRRSRKQIAQDLRSVSEGI
jgi:TP901 family phage tail tape measure protein/lambda family phage tail tape measure protein